MNKVRRIGWSRIPGYTHTRSLPTRSNKVLPAFRENWSQKQVVPTVMKKFKQIIAASWVMLFIVGDFALGSETQKSPVLEDLSIYEAAVIGDLSTVRQLLKANPDLINAKKDGSTPLSRAAGGGHLETVKFLLESGADIIVADRGQTALHYAAMSGSNDVVRFFLGRKMNVNAKDDYRKTPLHYVDSGSATETLLANGADINARDFEFLTPLHSAAYRGKEGVVQVLLSHHADVNLGTPDGITPLMVASIPCTAWASRTKQEQLKTIEVLVANKADVNLQNKYGMTALHMAATAGFLDVMRFLLKNGAKVDLPNNSGYTPFIGAARYGLTEVMQILWENDANIDAKAEGTFTALMLAVIHNNKEAAEFLLRKHADVNLADENGKTPLDYAIDFKRDRMIKLLRSHGAKGRDDAR